MTQRQRIGWTVVVALTVIGCASQVPGLRGANQLTRSMALPLSTIVDSRGRRIAAGKIPESLRQRISYLTREELRRGLGEHDPASLVLATVDVPSDEPDRTVQGSLIGDSWNGGMEFCTEAGLLCIRLTDFGRPAHLDVSKLGYKTLTLAVPTVGTEDTIIWIGRLRLERFRSEQVTSVSGTIRTEDGRPLEAPGQVTVAGRPCTLEHGAFRCEGLPPGEHPLDVRVEGYSVVWSKVRVTDLQPVTLNPVAYPLATLTLRSDTGSGAEERSLKVRPRFDGGADTMLGGRKIRIEQDGPGVSLYSAEHQFAVCRSEAAMGTCSDTIQKAWHSWYGQLVSGDVVVILRPDKTVEGFLDVVSVSR